MVFEHRSKAKFIYVRFTYDKWISWYYSVKIDGWFFRIFLNGVYSYFFIYNVALPYGWEEAYTADGLRYYIK